ncbi:hypothetical protein [Streptomyces sp. DH12]|uniref:hypothetical protein n=1 Tax=Streptomyces sp. DH12 TaxID=2857010 RepID=UPI001E417A75|nr:hypothetical protein [Streptomyces sp. DH12]
MERGTPVENRTTREFLDDGRGASRAVATTDPAFDGTHAWLGRPVFNRPAFLEAAEARALEHDLGVVLRVLSSLPERLHGGDPGRMARALGLPPAQADAVARCAVPGPAVPLGRADVLREGGRFRLVEFNTTSSLGGCEIAEMSRAMLCDPALREFAERHGLGYADPVAGMLASMDAACPDRSGLPVAVVKWPDSPQTAEDFGHMRLFLRQLADLGREAFPCHIGQLAYRDGVLTARGRRVDRVFRTFQLSRLTGTPQTRELAAPLLDAVADGNAALFAPLPADLYGIKDCLALLGDEAHRDVLSPSEREVVDRLVPWTRPLRPGPVTYRGERADLLDVLRARREELVVKPSAGYAGQGVTGGWMVGPDAWERRVAEALSGGVPHVVQERVVADAERFVDDEKPDVLTPTLLNWGVFHTVHGYSGAFVKGVPHAAQDVRFLGDGSHVGCVFHQVAHRTGEARR